MRIETLKTAPDRAGRYWVAFCDGTKLGLYRQTVEDFGLYPGLELSEEQMEALQLAASRMSAKMRAVRIVTASSVAGADLEQRLIHKGEDPAQAKEAVQWLQQLQLLDDRKTARQVVDSAIAKGYGLARAKQALYEKRIPREYWQEALADYPDQGERILSFLRTRLDGDADRKEIKRAVDALLRKGHSYETVRSALAALQLEWDTWEE